MKKEIKKAILDVLMASIDKGNYGMLSTREASYQSYKILATEKGVIAFTTISKLEPSSLFSNEVIRVERLSALIPPDIGTVL